MAEAPGTTAKIAIALSLAAVITVAIAVVVVVTREESTATVAATAPNEAGRDERHAVRAADVIRLDRDSIEAVTGGIKVRDPALRRALSLDAIDVITSISGKSIKRQFDVYDALLGVSMMNAMTLYIEVTREGTTRLVRWQLDGDLRDARNLAAPR